MKRKRAHSITVRKLPTGCYQLRHMDLKTGKRTSLGPFTTKRGSDAKKSQFLYELSPGTFVRTVDISFGAFVAEHIASIPAKTPAVGPTPPPRACG